MVQLLTLRVELVFSAWDSEDCVRVIEIREDDTLCSLHWAIQDAVGFDNDHLYEFFAGRHMTQRKVVYGDCDPGDLPPWVPDSDLEDYDTVRLTQVFPLPKSLKLYYLFDFGDSWTFQIRKSRKVREPEPGVQYPRVVESIGPNPVQYPTWE